MEPVWLTLIIVLVSASFIIAVTLFSEFNWKLRKEYRVEEFRQLAEQKALHFNISGGIGHATIWTCATPLFGRLAACYTQEDAWMVYQGVHLRGSCPYKRKLGGFTL